MRVLMTGHDGYIGPVMLAMFQAAGHQVTGLDSFFFRGCSAAREPAPVPALRLDVRDVEERHLRGFDAVVHLAGLSNDPLGDLDPELTYAINHRASVRLAELARAAGVGRFLFSSSCSVYGAAGDDFLTEKSPVNPQTPYAVSKARVEDDVSRLADRAFSPVFLRNATAYGASPRLRGDLVLNNLVGFACTTGEVLIKSDGQAWRPLVHVEDISRAFLAVLEAPRELIHNQAFNVGQTAESYRVCEIAAIVSEKVPGSRVSYSPDAGPDRRSYRVDCSRIARTLPAFQPRWTVRQGAEEVYAAYQRDRLTLEGFLSARYVRLKQIKGLLARGRLDASLRWRQPAATLAGATGP